MLIIVFMLSLSVAIFLRIENFKISKINNKKLK